jgi:hypothetical protein
MLLLDYALVKAPEVGWSTTRTSAALAAAAVLLAAFVANELRVANPLVPLSILRIKGVAGSGQAGCSASRGGLPPDPLVDSTASDCHLEWCLRAQSARTVPRVMPRRAWRVLGWMSAR